MTHGLIYVVLWLYHLDICSPIGHIYPKHLHTILQWMILAHCTNLLTFQIIIASTSATVLCNKPALYRIWHLRVTASLLASFPGLHAQLLSKKAGGRPGRSRHMIRATLDITTRIIYVRSAPAVQIPW